MFNNFKISTRISLGFAALIALVALLAASTTKTGLDTEASVAELQRTASIVSGLKDLLLSVRQGRVLAWTYMATGDESFLKSRDEAFEQFKVHYAKLDSELTDPTGRQLAKDFHDAVTGFEAKAVAMNELKHKGAANDSAEVKAIIPQVNDAAKLYATTNDKAATYYEESSRKADAEAEQRSADQVTIALFGGGVGVLLGAAIAWFIGRGITRPVNAVTTDMGRLAAGDLEITIVGTERRDEIGSLARSLEVFKSNAVEAKRLAARDAEETAAKARRATAVEQHISRFDNSVRSTLEVLTTSATELRATAESLTGTATSASERSSTVTEAAEEASANVQTVAAASEEMASSISEITRRVTQSSEIAGQAVQEAGETQVTIASLSEAAQRIGDVVRLINGIASQTNLLALNATIEAARAGEAGKGFAVVASEVKTLANQTARATDEIAGQVNSMRAATDAAVNAIDRIHGTIANMNEISTEIAAAMEQQGAATREISRNAHLAAQGMHDVTRNIDGVNRTVNETGAASGQVLSAAHNLQQQAGILRGDIGSFLGQIRTA